MSTEQPPPYEALGATANSAPQPSGDAQPIPPKMMQQPSAYDQPLPAVYALPTQPGVNFQQPGMTQSLPMSPGYGPQQNVTVVMSQMARPPNYLVPSILSCLFCCCILGKFNYNPP